MSRPYLPLTIAAALTFGLAGPVPAAVATTYCVGVSQPGCETRPTAAAAFADAVGGDRIELGALNEPAALDDGGRQLTVVGAGEGVTVLAGGLKLSNSRSEIVAATVAGLDLAGVGTRVHVQGTAGLHGSALLQAARVTGGGGVDAVDGAPRLETVVLELTGGPGLRVRCAARLDARHVTLAGTPDAAVTLDCPASEARVRDSILAVPPAAVSALPDTVATEYTSLPPVSGRTDGPGDRHDDPGFVPGSLRPAAGSPLIDAGSPEPIGGTEWLEDRDGGPRAADGNGDGVLVRDPGAFELQPPALPLPSGNLLLDPGAEVDGGWLLAGGFARERYGVFPFPSAATGAVLGAGGGFFAGGPAPASSATQRVDLTAIAPEVDRGAATAALSGLLGGYRANADSGSVEAAFLGPAGQPLGTLTLATPAAAERANATTLLPRALKGTIPPLSRAVEVTLRATLATGDYSDAYFDNLGLTVTAPGVGLPPTDPGQPPLKPFAGVRVLTPRSTVDRRGRVPVRLACLDGTVGRCSGVITLTAALRKGAVPVWAGAASVSLGAGDIGRARVPLTRAARRAVRARKRMRMKLYASVRDGQGLTRVSTVPLVVRWRAPAQHRRRR